MGSTNLYRERTIFLRAWDTNPKAGSSNLSGSPCYILPELQTRRNQTRSVGGPQELKLRPHEIPNRFDETRNPPSWSRLIRHCLSRGIQPHNPCFPAKRKANV